VSQNRDARHGIDPRAGVLPPGFRPRAEPKRIVIPAGVTPPQGYEKRVKGAHV